MRFIFNTLSLKPMGVEGFLKKECEPKLIEDMVVFGLACISSTSSFYVFVCFERVSSQLSHHVNLSLNFVTYHIFYDTTV